jgi:hypothetical protein
LNEDDDIFSLALTANSAADNMKASATVEKRKYLSNAALTEIGAIHKSASSVANGNMIAKVFPGFVLVIFAHLSLSFHSTGTRFFINIPCFRAIIPPSEVKNPY